MGSQVIDEASVLAQFDALVRKGTVLYSDNLKKIHHQDGGSEFEFRLTSALKTKPAAVFDNSELDAATTPPKSPSPSPAAGTDAMELDAEGQIPGGDISVAGFVISPVNNTHVLMFNKFCAYRPHLILLTANGYRRQFEPLGREDLEAARDVLRGLNSKGGSEYLVIFNCGKDGGCSRLHKHMQVIPAPSDFRLWPDEEALEAAVPYEYLLKRFENGVPGGEEVAGMYGEMLRAATALVPGREEVVEEDGVAVPHNVVLSERWMVVVPRTKMDVDGGGVNAAGMLGMVWASGEETYERWMGLGPREVLAEVGVRKR
ncbi:Diadenosine 5',5'''-P1,P4-tetraphosphate phosphorylase 2 [Colletotrichum aenigma]|uniref:Diadenosine 5',5'''-P1,P4-tetraphosphate phosphorylase 2 n=1 Tax=Colletotrichum aenigma TaxID=1215731 RepID=UPI0018731734|nr:Diadenosine 5',5'''-P1,P4-tetraphosphate phosphorylase 2 [Colletotrichum aenigma]KAF5512960.1 Diadenosine 5',5'''-P1,P4-tetraphosphate phosphorylase 2 [Colletotrichum aenigma]